VCTHHIHSLVAATAASSSLSSSCSSSVLSFFFTWILIHYKHIPTRTSFYLM
jgi:hypothetical protein